MIFPGADWHPNLLRYHGKDNDENFVYLASDLCASTLHALVERPDFSPYTADYSVAPNAMTILREVTTGIDFLHSLGVVHCDIKPRNILLTPADQVKVSDMGLSKKLAEEESSFTFSTNAPSGDGGWAPAGDSHAQQQHPRGVAPNGRESAPATPRLQRHT